MRPRRPFLAAAAALAAGSALGAHAPLGALAPLAVATGLALGLCLMRRPFGPWAAVWLLCCAAQALRVARAAPDPAALREGRIEILRAGEGALLARLGGPRGTLLELPPGAAREGERVRVLDVPASEASGEVAADALVRVAPASAGERLRARLHARCARFASPWSRGLAAALLLGERDGLDAASSDLFARVGLRHLLAVSGLHVGLVGALLLAPLAALAARPSHRNLALALGLALYAPIAGGAAPVRRAALAGALAVLASSVGAARGGRRVDALSLWGAALTLELTLDPRALGDVGLQLSYAAVLGLLVGARGIDRCLTLGSARSAEALDARRGWVRLPGILARRAARAARLALAASIAASAATLPLVAAHFGEWSPAGVVVTPPALLLTALLLASGWPALLLPGAPGGALFEGAANALAGLARAADALPGTPLALPDRPWVLGLALATAGLAALRPGVAPVWGRLAALGAALWLLPWSAAPQGLELVALDVGHGSALLWRAPGAGTWVFDAGSRDRSGVGRSLLGPALAAWDPGEVGVALSHTDRDHRSGLDWLVERRPPRAWWGALPAPLGERLPHACPRLDLERGALSMRLGGDLSATLLRGSPARDNEGSRALALAWRGRSVVLCGDAEDDGLIGLIELWRPRRGLDLLLLPHHGSHSPWLGELLDAWRPREVWISAAAPPPVAAELERRGVRWRCTSAEGDLRLELNALPERGTEAAIPTATRTATRTEDAGSSQDAGARSVVHGGHGGAQGPRSPRRAPRSARTDGGPCFTIGSRRTRARGPPTRRTLELETSCTTSHLRVASLFASRSRPPSCCRASRPRTTRRAPPSSSCTSATAASCASRRVRSARPGRSRAAAAGRRCPRAWSSAPAASARCWRSRATWPRTPAATRPRNASRSPTGCCARA